ncbi:MAG TPA: methyltransferase domain-containing protein [Pyrinomonadaceae bacterium]|nr:methyltransferase domain-containing protein [Pyrinomonadaceae bacterium]
MQQLNSFLNLHNKDSIIVCGCGESLNELQNPERFITIGVNDVGRKFQPNYLVVVNPRQQFSGDRFRFVENSSADFVFTQLDLSLKRRNIVRFKLGKFCGTDFSNKNVLHYTNNSPYIALNLAILMGAKRIGLIGVDFTENHFFAKTGTHPLSRQFDSINEQYKNLAEAAKVDGVEIYNLSKISRLTAFPKLSIEEFSNSQNLIHKKSALKIVSYSTMPVAGVPSVLARCINEKTENSARCVWETNGYSNGVVFDGDVEWKNNRKVAENLLVNSDLIIVHNGKTAAAHESIFKEKPVITMAHNYLWNVDESFVNKGFPSAVIGQYQAVLPEFKDWSIVPNPLPFWENIYQNRTKNEQISICFTPFGKHEKYPKNHRLYWHSKGFETTLKILEKLSRKYDVKLETTKDGQISNSESIAMKNRSHIVIDECVTGSYHRNSLEGLAAGCVVVNGVGILPKVDEVFRFCSKTDEIPFVFSNLEKLEKTLENLILLGKEKLERIGRNNRIWLEKNWDFEDQWNEFWMPLIERAFHSKNVRKISQPIVQTVEKKEFLVTKSKLQGEFPTMTIAKKEDLNLTEFAAFNQSFNYPVMRRWELPFALFQMQLSGFMSVLDCTINPVNFQERIQNLYPNVVYKHHQPIKGNKQFALPNGLPDEAFDRVVCINTLEHLFKSQREELLAEMARKLKPGGFLVITCDQYPDDFSQKPELLKMGLVRADGGEVFNGFNRVTELELIETLQEYGLKPISETIENIEENEKLRNIEPYPHTCLGMVFGKSEKPVLPKGKKIMLSLLSWNTKESTIDSLNAYLNEAEMLKRLGCEPFIVVCDNGSVDGTCEILAELDKEIQFPHKFFLNKENKGSSIARNQIIDLMLERGDDYLLMMDGDIEIVPFSSFAMMRYMEEQGRLMGCIGPHSSGFSPLREKTTQFQFDLSKCRKDFVNYVAWTQYGMFRREMFADGIRFDENKPFNGEGWGFEDNDLAFQIIAKGYQIQVFTGMTYLHRNVHSSIRVMKSKGSNPRENYENRRHYIINKWNKSAVVPPNVIKSLQVSQCPQV